MNVNIIHANVFKRDERRPVIQQHSNIQAAIEAFILGQVLGQNEHK